MRKKEKEDVKKFMDMKMLECINSELQRLEDASDIEEYKIEEELSKIDLIGFIDFCIRNQKQILRIDDLEII